MFSCLGVGLDYIADCKTAYTILEIQTLEYIFIHYILAIRNVITMVPVQAVQLLQKLRRGSNRRLIYSQLG